MSSPKGGCSPQREVIGLVHLGGEHVRLDQVLGNFHADDRSDEPFDELLRGARVVVGALGKDFEQVGALGSSEQDTHQVRHVVELTSEDVLGVLGDVVRIQSEVEGFGSWSGGVEVVLGYHVLGEALQSAGAAKAQGGCERHGSLHDLRKSFPARVVLKELIDVWGVGEEDGKELVLLG